ncbi:MAG: DUF4157 domain-containing protein [Kofleriaceae bacterium]
MTRWLHPPELEHKPQQDAFDPTVEGARLGLSREKALAIWEQVRAEATDRNGRVDLEQAARRFEEVGGQIPEPGRETLNDPVPDGSAETDRSAWDAGPRSTRGEASARVAPGRVTRVSSPAALGRSTPGRRTLVGPAVEPLGFDDYRTLGLRGVLNHLGRAHPLRAQVIEAAAHEDRAIAGRASGWSGVPARATPTPNGTALWQVAERHAVTLYRRAVSSAAVDPHDPAVDAALKQRGSGQPLPQDVLRQMERELGVSLRGTRVHTDTVAAQAARALNAEAFTVGEDIFFASGKYAPETPSGRKLLAHELTHVAQQVSGRVSAQPGEAGGPRVSQPDEQHEQEAEATAGRVDRGGVATEPDTTSDPEGQAPATATVANTADGVPPEAAVPEAAVPEAAEPQRQMTAAVAAVQDAVGTSAAALREALPTELAAAIPGPTSVGGATGAAGGQNDPANTAGKAAAPQDAAAKDSGAANSSAPKEADANTADGDGGAVASKQATGVAEAKHAGAARGPDTADGADADAAELASGTDATRKPQTADHSQASHVMEQLHGESTPAGTAGAGEAKAVEAVHKPASSTTAARPLDEHAPAAHAAEESRTGWEQERARAAAPIELRAVTVRTRPRRSARASPRRGTMPTVATRTITTRPVRLPPSRSSPRFPRSTRGLGARIRRSTCCCYAGHRRGREHQRRWCDHGEQSEPPVAASVAGATPAIGAPSAAAGMPGAAAAVGPNVAAATADSSTVAALATATAAAKQPTAAATDATAAAAGPAADTAGDTHGSADPLVPSITAAAPLPASSLPAAETAAHSASDTAPSAAATGDTSTSTALDVGAADDHPEREADAAADAVLAPPAPTNDHDDHDDHAPPPVSANTVPTRRVLRKAAATATARGADAEIASRLAGRVAEISGGTPLPDSEREFFEPRFGRDLRDVRIHAGPSAAQLAVDLAARAFTVGRNIVFGSGELSPGSTEGRRLLAHELAHVIQQTGGQPRAPAPRPSRLGRAVSTAVGAARAAAPVLSAAATSVQRLGLGDLNPLDWAKKALKALTGDADAGKAKLRGEGSTKGAEIDGHAQAKGSEIDADGKTRGGEVDADGKTKGGEIEADGKTRGGELDADGKTKGGELEAAGQERSAEVDASGHERGGELDAAGQQQAQQVESEARAHGQQLGAEAAARRAQVEADAAGKQTELQADAAGKDAELKAAGETKGAELQSGAEAKTREVDAERVKTELADEAEQAAVEKAITDSANALRDESRSRNSEVESGWNDVNTEATGLVARLDAQAGALCAKFEGKAKDFVAGLEKGIRPVFDTIKASFDTIQQEAERAWAAFMDTIAPALQAIEKKWTQFTDWVSKSVWEPLKQKAGELAKWAGDLISKAWEKAKAAWDYLKTKAEAAFNWIKEKALAAYHFLKNAGETARAWIKGKADAARAWIKGKADAARSWITAKAVAARTWIQGKAAAARSWMKGKADAARGFIKSKAAAARNFIQGKAAGARSWITGKAAGARSWIQGKAAGARGFIKGKADAARGWIKGKASAATSWVRDTGHGVVTGLESSAKGLVDSISSKGGPIMKWLGGQVNGVISGVADVGNSAVDIASSALGKGLQFVESKASGAITWVEQKATGAVTFVEQKATGAVSFVEQKATSAVSFVEQKATGAVSFVEQKATGAVNFVERKAIGAVNFVEGAATGAVSLLEGAANGAVGVLEFAARGAVTLVEGAVKLVLGGIALIGYGVYKLGEGAVHLVKAGWDKASEWLGKAYDWVKEKVVELGTWLNENVIQPMWKWMQAQWAAFQDWFKSKFPGLVKCWQVFKEWAGTIGAYIGEQLVALMNWFNALPDWMQYLILGMIAPFSSFPLIMKLWNELPPGVREGLHVVLDVLGLIPGYGAIADLVNSLLYLAEGDFLNAALGLVFAIPGLGDVAKGGDLLKDAGKLLKNLGPDALKLLKKLNPKELLELLKKGADAVADWLKRLGGKGAKETEKELAERLAREAAEREAKEKAAKEAAEKLAKEKAEKEAAEKAAKEAAEKEAREKAEREAAEKAAKEKAEKEAAEKAAKEKAEKEAAEKAAKEKAEKEAAEKAAKEKAEKEAAEKAAKEKAEKEAAEKAAKEKAEKEAAEKAAKEKAEKEAAEKAAKEKAEKEAAEKAAKEKAEKEAAEKAEKEAAEKAAKEARDKRVADLQAKGLDKTTAERFANLPPNIAKNFDGLSKEALERYAKLSDEALERFGKLGPEGLEKLGRLEANVLKKFAGWEPKYLENIAKLDDDAIDIIAKLKIAPGQDVVNALGSFNSHRMQFGSEQFLLDKRGMKHFLERHHPQYWDGSIKVPQSFLDPKMTVDNITSAVDAIMKQNREKVIKGGTQGMFQITGEYGGKKYVVGLNNGRVGQFYPVP